MGNIGNGATAALEVTGDGIGDGELHEHRDQDRLDAERSEHQQRQRVVSR